MSGRFLLDTNLVIALLSDEMIVKDNLAQANEVFIPSIIIGELCYGARKSGRVEANLASVDELVAGSTILICDVEMARHYGEVKNNLKLKGRPMPENDVWIVALALQPDLILITRGTYSQEVESLKIVA